MKARLILTYFWGIFLALVIEFCSLMFFPGSDPARWFAARSTSPALALIDVCAALLLAATVLLVQVQKQSGKLQTDFSGARTQHAEQIGRLVQRSTEMEQHNTQLSEALEGLKMEQETSRTQDTHEREQRAEETRFSLEARDEIIGRLEKQMEAHAKQLEAVNLALQYHRAELTQLRQGVRGLQHLEPVNRSPVARLTSAEYEAISQPISPNLSVVGEMMSEKTGEKNSPFQFLTTTDTAASEKRLTSFSAVEPQSIAPEELAG